MTGAGAVETAHEREKRALAAAGRPDDGHELAGADVQGDVTQRRDMHLVPAAELARDGVEAEADRLAEQILELVLVRRRRRSLDGGDGLHEHGYGGRLAVVAVLRTRCGGGGRDLSARAAASALGTA